jgi:hypothetical protein
LKRTTIFIFLLACSLAAAADSLKGVVQNLTTRKPSAGDEVILKKIGNGMEDVGKTKTNARGEFSFNVPQLQQPYVLWVQHQGVTYSGRAIPGGQPMVVRVFEASPDVKEINVIEHAMLFHTGDAPNTLTAEEIFSVNNTSNPPRTLLKPHTLEFSLPEGATISESSVRTSSGVDIKSPAVPQGEKNKYAFTFPVRPGETQFHLVYTLPYSGNVKIDPKLDKPVETLIVAAPESIKFSPAESSLFQSRNNPQFKGVNFFVAKNVTPQQQVAFEIAGTGAMPQQAQEAGAEAPGGAEGRPGGGLGTPNTMPSPMQSAQWLFLGVLTLFLGAGAVFVYTSNQQAPNATTAPAKPQSGGGLVMEAMREEIFQLESDRIQGKISPQEYETAKAALDKTLQRAVQRQSAAKAN